MTIKFADDFGDLSLSGTLEFEVSDTAVGWVPYGEARVWHPGNGLEVEVTSVDLDDGDDEVLEQLVKDKFSDGWRAENLVDIYQQRYQDDLVDYQERNKL